MSVPRFPDLDKSQLLSSSFVVGGEGPEDGRAQWIRESDAGELRAFVNGDVLVKTGSMPLTSLTDERLLTLGELARGSLGADAMMELSVTASTEPCTVSLGRGTYGVVRRVCSALRRSAPSGMSQCSGCVALKMQLAIDVRHEDKAMKLLVSRQPALQRFLPRSFGGVVRDKRGVFLLESVTPYFAGGHKYPDVRTLVTTAPPSDLRRILPHVFEQVVLFLALAQEAVPGFRHNDLATNNVLLSPVPAGTWPAVGVGSRTVALVPDMPLIRVIDFGLAWAPNNVLTSPALPRTRLVTFDRRHLGYVQLVRSPSASGAEVNGTPLGTNYEVIEMRSGHVSEIERATIVPLPSRYYDLFYFTKRILVELSRRSDRSNPDIQHLLKTMEGVMQRVVNSFMGAASRPFASLFTGPPSEPDFVDRMTVEAQVFENELGGKGMSMRDLWEALGREAW